jgi:hypothetical protein
MATLKIDNQTTIKLPKDSEAYLTKALEVIPQEHVRGLLYLRLVDVIVEPRLRALPQASELPALYHPKAGTQQPWLEIAIAILMPPEESFLKRWGTKMSFKRNLVAVTFSLVAQHYYLTFRHSVKRTQLEAAVKSYTEKYLRLWGEKNQTRRARLFKPLQPTFERWAKALQKRAAAAQKKKKG